MKKGMQLESFLREIKRQSETRVDLVAPAERMSFDTIGGGDCTQGVLEVMHGTGGLPQAHRYPMNRYALGQMADVLHIPAKYVELMRTQQPDLLAENVNTWLRSLHGKGDMHSRLVRLLDGRVRAFLSPRYRIIDNRMLVEFLMPEMMAMGLNVDFASLELSDKALYIKAVFQNRNAEVQVNDVVQSGVVITNSEVGARRLSVYPLLYRLVCSNGLIMPEHGLKRNHVGRALTQDDLDTNVLSQEAITADNHALMLKVRDAVRFAGSEAMLAQMTSQLRTTLGITISGDPVQAVQVLSNAYALNKEEHDGVLEQLIRGAELSAFGLVNAVTAYAQQVDDYERSVELEEIGGKMLTLNQKQWKPIVEARDGTKARGNLLLTA